MSKPTPYQQISQHMNQAHPGVRYEFKQLGVFIHQAVTTDWGTGVNLTFKGLVVRYKPEGTRLTKRNGAWSTDRIAEQAAQLDAWAEHNYIAQFGVGIDESKRLIDSYLNDGAAVTAEVSHA
jgi:hypothetical protein